MESLTINQPQEENWSDKITIDHIVTIVVSLLICALMVGAFRISFSSMSEEAAAFGIKNPKVFPWIVDGFIVVASGLMLWGEFRKEEEVVKIGWWGVVLATILTLIFNIGHAPYIKQIVSGGWASVTHRPLDMVFQTLYAAVSPALLAFALHALTVMLGKIVAVSTELADLRQAQQTAETAREEIASQLQTAEIDLKAAEIARQEAETLRQAAETACQDATRHAQQLRGQVQSLEKQIDITRTDLQQREVAWQAWHLMGPTAQQFLLKVLLEQAMTQKQFAESFNVNTTAVSRFKSFLELEASRDA